MTQIVYFSHGGGPLPILGDAGHEAMVDFMRQLPSQLRKPEAILVISAHWEEARSHPDWAPATRPCSMIIMASPRKPIKSPTRRRAAPSWRTGLPDVLQKNQIATHIDPQRGFDHGLFIPLKLMYPNADIPTLQLSLLRGLNPAAHLALGKALRELMPENILVVGSGFSFHNLRAFSWAGDGARRIPPMMPFKIG